MDAQKLQTKFKEIWQKFDFFPSSKICVAVSGGADSMALLSLLINAVNNDRLHVITINHKLRPEAEEEANFVNSFCASNKIRHEILAWPENRPLARNQNEAREVRYDLINQYCKQYNIINIITAHHKDDVIENFFIRINRGSGLRGVANSLEFENYNISENIKLIKPLLNFNKKNLIEYLEYHKISWKEDASNFNDKYLRNRIRANLNVLDLNLENLFTTILNLSLTNINYENRLNELEVNCIRIHPFKLAEIDLNKFLKYSVIDQGRIIADIIKLIGEVKYTPRFSSIVEIINSIKSGFKFKTLGNCLLEINNNILHVYPEYKFNKEKTVYFKENIIIEGFYVKNISINEHYNITPLTPEIWKKIKREFKNIPKIVEKIRYFLPIILDSNLNISSTMITCIKNNNIKMYWQPRQSLSKLNSQERSRELINLLHT
ncbi:MAG: tRNA lysidine(34) synthetase TilS [Sphingobacteriia bacterium]|nr:tRNA lysidine(34) synthetase TilS [Sphingobacteriia bacterium]